ncbi:MAG: hypothetical protein ACI4QE_03625 [Acutalibacteraceae bacterium]
MKKFFTVFLLMLICVLPFSSLQNLSCFAKETSQISDNAVIKEGNSNIETIPTTDAKGNTENTSHFTKENIIWIIVLSVLIILCVTFMVIKKKKDYNEKKRKNKK